MRFIKMNGAGNDYVFFDCITEELHYDPAKIAPKISDRNFGIGSDGIIIIGNSAVADCSMDIYNADGSRASMCGNGVRCVAQYFQKHYKSKSKIVTVETLAGIKAVKIINNSSNTALSSVLMGRPSEPQEFNVYLDCLNDRLKYFLVETGNKHAVCLAQSLTQEKFSHIAQEIQYRLNNDVNVEFLKEQNGEYFARVFERGSGETLACGTGATAIARTINKLKGDSVGTYIINFPGGKLTVEIDSVKYATLIGESVIEYENEIDFKNFCDLNSGLKRK